ncbi:MAG: DNA methyltransferase [Candidatus Altiarchaeota archaeon]
MPDETRLLKASLSGENPYERLLAPRFDYADLYTFSENKVTPVYNWFYYKEGYSRDFVTKTLAELEVPAESTVVDPFCGTGTTLLAARESGRPCAGVDILPLGAFVSRVKLEDGYDIPSLEEAVRWLTNLRYSEPKTRLIDIRFIDMRKVYNPYARNDIAFFRENILGVQDERTRNFLMLGLISIVSQASNVMKDGGVLRIVRKNHVPPVRHLLKTKLKRMVKDLKDRGNLPKTDWRADIGDARALPMEDESAGALITSPPYLNFVDYTKVYALELSLLLSNANEMEGLRKRSLRSHISASYERENPSEDMERILSRVTVIDKGKDKVPRGRRRIPHRHAAVHTGGLPGAGPGRRSRIRRRERLTARSNRRRRSHVRRNGRTGGIRGRVDLGGGRKMGRRTRHRQGEACQGERRNPQETRLTPGL